MGVGLFLFSILISFSNEALMDADLHQYGFLRYETNIQNIEKDFQPPFFNNILQIHPKSVTWRELFEDDHWIYLPPKTSIQRSKEFQDEKLLEIWTFPEGTQIVHRVWLTDDRARPYEIRRLRMQKSGLWAFEIFYPHQDRLEQVSEQTEKEVRIEHLEVRHQNSKTLAIQKVRIRIDRMHPSNCTECHSMDGNQPLPEGEDESHARPCDFTAENPLIFKKWVPRFKKTFGYDPFEPSSDN